MGKKPETAPILHDCRIEKMVFGGWGLAHVNDRPVFIGNVATNERVIARIYKKAKGVRYAESEQLLEVNQNMRTEKRCRHAGICGGCSYQHITHAAQIDTKQKILEEIYTGIPVKFSSPIESPLAFGYRNKMEFGFTRTQAGHMSFGLHPRGRFRHILDLQECHLVDPSLWQTGQGIKALLQKRDDGGILGEKGFWQHITLRQSFHDKTVLVTLEVANPMGDLVYQAAKDIRKNFPNVAGVLAKARHGLPMLLDGQNHLVEKAGPALFHYNAENFFQVNVSILPQLLDEMALLVQDGKPEHLIDLFSGVGLLGIALGKLIPGLKILGAESDETAVSLARENALRNGLENYQSVHFDLYQRGWAKTMPDAANGSMIVDPPRAGLTEKTLGEILQLAPKRIIYLSCNPTTQRRDIEILQKGGYRLNGLRLVDMFPQTYHLESLAWLDKA